MKHASRTFKGRIDPATGRNRRDNLTRGTYGGPERWNGRIVPKGRLEHARRRATGGSK